MSPAPSPSPRPTLSRHRVVEAAVAFADEHGIDGLSMRKLAQSLGVEAMSLYHHVANKDDLIDGMVDAVFAEIERPAPGVPWREAIRRRCLSLHDAMLRHPWAVGRLDSRRTPGLGTLGHHDAVIGCLRAGGLSVDLTALAFATLDAYVYGFALQELAIPRRPDESYGELAEDVLSQLPVEELPNLAAFTAEHVAQPGYDFAETFEPGLDLVLDALEQRLTP